MSKTNPSRTNSLEAKDKGMKYWDYMKEYHPEFVHEIPYQSRQDKKKKQAETQV